MSDLTKIARRIKTLNDRIDQIYSDRINKLEAENESIKRDYIKLYEGYKKLLEYTKLIEASPQGRSQRAARVISADDYRDL